MQVLATVHCSQDSSY